MQTFYHSISFKIHVQHYHSIRFKIHVQHYHSISFKIHAQQWSYPFSRRSHARAPHSPPPARHRLASAPHRQARWREQRSSASHPSPPHPAGGPPSTMHNIIIWLALRSVHNSDHIFFLAACTHKRHARLLQHAAAWPRCLTGKLVGANSVPPPAAQVHCTLLEVHPPPATESTTHYRTFAAHGHPSKPWENISLPPSPSPSHLDRSPKP